MFSGKINLKKAEFDLTIQVSDDGSEHLSSEIVMSDIPWKIKIVERSNENGKTFEAALICSSPKSSELSGRMQWSCDAKVQVSIQYDQLINIDRRAWQTYRRRNLKTNAYQVNLLRLPEPPILRNMCRMIGLFLIFNCLSTRCSSKSHLRQIISTSNFIGDLKNSSISTGCWTRHTNLYRTTRQFSRLIYRLNHQSRCGTLKMNRRKGVA